jgi:protease II
MVFYFKTNRDAPKYRVVRADLSSRASGVEPAWTEIMPQREDVLVDATSVGRGRRLACVYMRHAQELLSLHELSDGSLVQDVQLPDLGTISALRGRTEVNQSRNQGRFGCVWLQTPRLSGAVDSTSIFSSRDGIRFDAFGRNSCRSDTDCAATDTDGPQQPQI